MEGLEEFLKTKQRYGDGSGDGSGSGDGDGSGSGDGYGDGSSYGYGSGSGSGDGSGSSSGDGYGDGYGDGSDLKSLDNNKIYRIDGVNTIITNLKQNIAKGFIVNNDLTTTPCYVAKIDGCFAHAETIKEAVEEATAKALQNTPIEERLQRFRDKFEPGVKYSGYEFYKWHNILTNSCKLGRDSFVKNNNIKLDDKFTVKEFVEKVKNNYGSDIIEQLGGTK